MTPDSKAKPFPWRCPKCLQREVRPATIEYCTQVKHDGRLHQVALRDLIVPRCPTCGELVFCNDTDEQISRALRDQLGLVQPHDIRSRREAMGLTQKALAKLIGVAPETISRWESGFLIQSRAMDTLLRIFFNFAEVREALGAGLESSGSLGIPGDCPILPVTAPFEASCGVVPSMEWSLTASYAQPLSEPWSVMPVVPQELPGRDESSLEIAESEVRSGLSNRIAA
jgi:putative zinc finger/helix-turn-helix YgiT family protein